MEKRILIIDDEKKLCFVVKAGLEKIGGFDVSIATNGKDGIRAAKRLKPDLILLDVCMPKMDGLSVLKRLKENRDTIAIPIIMLTGLSDDATKKECSRLYDEAYLEKPVEITALSTKIDEVLKRRGTMGEN
jgi:DNA-binding response OmpR family regulator